MPDSNCIINLLHELRHFDDYLKLRQRPHEPYRMWITLKGIAGDNHTSGTYRVSHHHHADGQLVGHAAPDSGACNPALSIERPSEGGNPIPGDR